MIATIINVLVILMATGYVSRKVMTFCAMKSSLYTMRQQRIMTHQMEGKAREAQRQSRRHA